MDPIKVDFSSGGSNKGKSGKTVAGENAPVSKPIE